MQQYPEYLLWNRRKTLTGSPDPTRANGTNRPCNHNDKFQLLDRGGIFLLKIFFKNSNILFDKREPTGKKVQHVTSGIIQMFETNY